MIKIVPTSDQVKTIQKYGLRFEDVVLGPADGDITVKETWKVGENDRFYVIERSGKFTIEYKTPVENA